MGWKQVRVEEFKRALVAGCGCLGAHREEVNALNVFPVPDGDTGTNMLLTMQAAVREMDGARHRTVGAMAAALALGALMGARGNSGVILSQLFRGFSQVVGEKDFLTAEDLARGFVSGADVAYRAVAQPVEGTILTVAKAFAAGFREAVTRNLRITDALGTGLSEANRILGETPRMLPVLAEAGVVDAGGRGLVLILEGIYRSFCGQEVATGLELSVMDKISLGMPTRSALREELAFQYCTELLVQGNQGNQVYLDELRNRLKPLGDCLLVVGAEQVARVHIHTNEPGQVLTIAGSYGTMHHLKIDNMGDQHRESAEFGSAISAGSTMGGVSTAGSSTSGLVAVAAGEGLAKILQSLGANAIVFGGQTMNPSIEDLAAGINQANTTRVLVLPNNKNVILAAEQAGALVDKEVAVVPTRSLPQGLAAVMAFDPQLPLAENKARMAAAASCVKTGEVTAAVRDARYGDMDIRQGAILGLLDGEIRVQEQDVEDAALALLRVMDAGSAEIAAMFYGSGVTEVQAGALVERVRRLFPSLEVELHNGGQPLYDYILSVE